MSFLAAGGVVMVPVLVLGGSAVVLALRHLFAPARTHAVAAASARHALALAAVGGSALDLWAVGTAVGGGAFGDADVVRIAMVGAGEAMVPAAVGLGLAALAGLVSTLGDTRRAEAA